MPGEKFDKANNEAKKVVANAEETSRELKSNLLSIQTSYNVQQTESVERQKNVASHGGSAESLNTPNDDKSVSKTPSSKNNSNIPESKSYSELGVGIVHSVFSTLSSLSKTSSGRWYILLCVISLLILDAINLLVTKVLVYTGIPMYASVSSLLLHFILRLIAAGIFDLSMGYLLQPLLKKVLQDNKKQTTLQDNKKQAKEQAMSQDNKKHVITSLLFMNVLYIIFNVICAILSGNREELNLGIIFAAFILSTWAQN